VSTIFPFFGLVLSFVTDVLYRVLSSFVTQFRICTPKGPDEVIKFCTDCVLSEEEEPCDVPSTIFRDEDVSDGGLSP
jgi:hypothetical protein